MSIFFQQRFERLKKRYDIPASILSICNFQNMIGLADISGGKYDICITKHATYMTLSICYKHTQNYFDLVANNIRELSPDINRLISEYLSSYITMNIRMDYPNNYPFDGPEWSLVSCDDRLASSLKNAEEYYKYIITTHNSTNTTYWSPAINIDSDILAFIVRINHFDSLFL